MAEEKMIFVKNRSSSKVVYTIPEKNNLRRYFEPGEVKKIPVEELQILSYQKGGLALIKSCLMITDMKTASAILGEKPEPEYFFTDEKIVYLIQNGSMDEWLDALDFAPDGVIDLIKDYCIKLPITDYNKMEAFKQKFEIDLDKIIRNMREVAIDEGTKTEVEAPKKRRVQVEEEPEAPARRTTPKYNIVSEG